MFAALRSSVVMLILMTLITGVAYPALVTGVAKLAFYRQAEGSVIVDHEKEIGSALIAQPFTEAKYFWPRPSAANYDATAGAGSNLAPSNPALADAVKDRVVTLHTADTSNNAAVPIDLVTASGSGLDPHISLNAAYFQETRVAKARGMSIDQVHQMINSTADSALLGVLGDPTVNVLELNLRLDHPQSLASTTAWRARGFQPDLN